MPNDLNPSIWFLGSAGVGASGTANRIIQGGLYGFTTLTRNAISNAAVVVIARTETDGSLSNWVTASGANTQTSTGQNIHSGAVQKGAEADAYERNCISVTYSGQSLLVPGGICTANRNSPDLRYIYVY
jgi:hypothetical protein